MRLAVFSTDGNVLDGVYRHECGCWPRHRIRNAHTGRWSEVAHLVQLVCPGLSALLFWVALGFGVGIFTRRRDSRTKTRPSVYQARRLDSCI